MASGHLLIIAPDPDLRHSLEFALEAEGYTVAAVATVDEAAAPERFDCTILDHRAAIGPTLDMVSFCQRAYPVVLLASERPPEHIEPLVFRSVQKPQLGEPLSAAVREALAARHGARPQ